MRQDKEADISPTNRGTEKKAATSSSCILEVPYKLERKALRMAHPLIRHYLLQYVLFWTDYALIDALISDAANIRSDRTFELNVE